MTLTWEALFLSAARVLLLGAAALYAGLVLKAYRRLGPRIRLRMKSRDPGRSALTLSIWLGVRALAGIGRAARVTLDVLSDASAEVGEWYFRHRDQTAQAHHRSRFL